MFHMFLHSCNDAFHSSSPDLARSTIVADQSKCDHGTTFCGWLSFLCSATFYPLVRNEEPWQVSLFIVAVVALLLRHDTDHHCDQIVYAVPSFLQLQSLIHKYVLIFSIKTPVASVSHCLSGMTCSTGLSFGCMAWHSRYVTQFLLAFIMSS